MSRSTATFARCLEKQSFRSLREAQQSAAKWNRINRCGGGLHAYKCKSCGRYHTGNSHYQPPTNAGQRA